MDIKDLKSNSKTSKQELQESHVTRTLSSGKAIGSRTSLKRKFSEIFLAEDMSEVKNYFIYDVVYPKIKDAIFDILSLGLEASFYSPGKSRRKTRSNGGGMEYKDYSSISSGTRRNVDYAKASRTIYDFNDIVFDSRAAAEEVLDILCEILDKYTFVRVADLYEAANIKGNGYTDNHFGWRDLGAAYVTSTRRGWILVLPRCIQLDN